MSRREPPESRPLKIACAPEYRESALQGLRRPIFGTALHTGRLSKSYRCAGRTRNRLTISYLTITAAQAFFNTRLRQCPNSNILLTAPLSSFAAVHVRSSGNTIGHSSNVASTPPAASKARRLTHRTIFSFRHQPYRARDTATSSPPRLGLQPGRDSGTAAGIYGLRRLKAKHCAEPVGEARSVLDFCLYIRLFGHQTFFRLI